MWWSSVVTPETSHIYASQYTVCLTTSFPPSLSLSLSRYVFLALLYYYTFNIEWAVELRWEWIAYGTSRALQTKPKYALRDNLQRDTCNAI